VIRKINGNKEAKSNIFSFSLILIRYRLNNKTDARVNMENNKAPAPLNFNKSVKNKPKYSSIPPP
jgi:hypothetical protein